MNIEARLMVHDIGQAEESLIQGVLKQALIKIIDELSHRANMGSQVMHLI